MRAIVLLSIFITLFGCVPQASLKGRSIASSQAPSDGTTDDTTGGSSNLSNYYWYTGGTITQGTIQLDQSMNDSIFIRGEGIENWLNSKVPPLLTTTYFNHRFCLIATFDDNGAKKQARFKAVAMSYPNPQTGKIEKLIRVDLASSSASSNQCSGTLTLTLENGTSSTTTTVTTNESGFTIDNICPTCSVPITADHVGIVFFDSDQSLNTAPLSADQSTYFYELSSIGLAIKAKQASSGGSNTCSDASCSALGKDCCIEGQCVMNATIRPNAQATYPADYTQAMLDFQQNPASYVNWPQIFYVCQGGVNPIPTPTPTPTPDPGRDAQDQLAELTAQYNCLTAGKDGDYSKCEPDHNETSYNSVRLNVWQKCGCEANFDIADPTPPMTSSDPTHPINACPDFSLKVTEQDAAGTPTKIECLVPDPDPVPTPFQQLNVQVSSRSVPHRFFKTDGTAVDSLEGIDQSTKQEAQTTSSDGDYDMNQILGEMRVDLSKSQPAKIINVEYNQSYVIRTKSGSYYTPCPQCSKDSWYEGFTAYPQPYPVHGTLFGNGLQGSPTTTSRTTSSISSVSKGNYEDTVWGRACWVPPTMIPLSHKEYNDVQKQRQHRLETQAALYMNGYRKDWYGFNQGALIGSFDGVKWFAIGSGRQVTATSKKLFLAINAPFADLASLSSMSVEIVEYLGPNSVAMYDFDPTLSLNDPRQNLAASCQSFHICDTDADCISKLGWEYMCAPINAQRSKWPQFDINADEEANKSITVEGYMQMLQNGVAPSQYPKRCVYRGSGAPCLQDISSLVSKDANGHSDNDSTLKHLACAPNFYCASLDTLFNEQINRTPELLGSYLYGQEANVLGRPFNYVGGTKSLLSSIKDNLEANMKLYNINYTKDKIGICRPGKAPLTNPYSAHHTADVQKRTDYISQIGSCEPTNVDYKRVMSCPYVNQAGDFTDIDEEDLPEGDRPGNYQFIDPTSSYTTADKEHLKRQNSCGQESLKSSGESPFELIEAKRLPLQLEIKTPKLAINACFRRAGSICHSDLDCSPNYMQSDAALSYDKSYFGNTEAEKRFWQEDLVCGQAAPVPSLSDISLSTYSLTKNRCCRPIGKEFTMFTQTDMTGYISDMDSGDVNVLDTDLLSVDDPKAEGRYSRYTSANPSYNKNNRNTTTGPNVHAETPAVLHNPPDSYGASETPLAFQWKTFHDTGRRTCCGAGFIRKFSDGSHNWTKRDRLSINTSNFQCLNYRNNFYDVNHTVPLENGSATFKSLLYSKDNTNFERELSLMCISPGDKGCIQYPFAEPTDNFSITAPQLVPNYTAVMTTVPIIESSDAYQRVDRDTPYVPAGYNMAYPGAAPGETQTPINYMPGPTQSIVFFHLPIYVDVRVTKSDSNGDGDTEITAVYFDNIGYSTDHNPNNVGNNADVYIQYVCEDATVDDALAISTDTTNARIRKLTYQPDVDGTFKCDDLKDGNGFDDDDSDNSNLKDEHWCLTSDGVFFANADNDNDTDDGDGYDATQMCDKDGAKVLWSIAGIKVRFTPVNTPNHIYSDGTTHPELSGLRGRETDNQLNATYYLSKLGRLELLGIPQIYYEPLYCNSNHNELVTGLYKEGTADANNNVLEPKAINDKADAGADDWRNTLVDNNNHEGIFKYGKDYSGSTSYRVATSLGKIYANSITDSNFYVQNTDDSNPDGYTFLKNLVETTHSQIFSESEFLCCAKLGTLTSDYHNCCSGYGQQESGNLSYTCLLPVGTDLNVYFNRFVSSEGYVDDLPEKLKEFGLTDDDFVPETGEPRLTGKVYDKISALGQAYCTSGKVRPGAAFGKYRAEPYVGYTRDRNDNEADKNYFSIIDSSLDFDEAAQNGNTFFNFGFRWNHHLYCDL